MYDIALKNIALNPRRSLMTLLGIAAGAAGLLLALGFMRANFDGLKANFISENGHIQIFSEAFFKDKDLLDSSTRIDDYQALVNEIMSWDHVEVVTPRLSFSGLVGNEERSLMMIGNAVLPGGERKIGAGGFFAPIKGGEYLQASGASDAVCLGEGLAKKLNLTVGSQLSILANTVDGSYNSLGVTVQCLVRYGVEEYNNAKIEMNLVLAQKLLASGQVDNLVVLLDDDVHLDEIKHKMQNLFAKSGRKLIAKDWVEVSPYYVAVKNLYSRIFLFLVLLIFIIMALSIINNISTSVFERYREIGVIRAIGGTRFEIAQLFLYESLLIAVLGGVVGITLYGTVVWVVQKVGITMPPAPGRTYSYPLTFQLDAVHFAYVMGVCAVTAAIASILPARKASRIEITESLNYV